MDFYEGAIKLQGYEPIDQLSDNGYSSAVCFLAEKKGKQVVFKFPNISKKGSQNILDSKDVFSIRRENEVLKLLKGIPAAPQEVYYSDCCNFHDSCERFCPRSYSPLFLRREYISGKELVNGVKIRGENSSNLKNLVLLLHIKGYAGLDLTWPGNVIIDSNGMPWTVDLGSASKIGDKFEHGKRTGLVGRTIFEELREKDLSDLARICA